MNLLRLFFLPLLCLLSIQLFSQPATGFKYQAVARMNGELVDDEPITVEVSILNDGNEVYSENHATETNGYGLFSLNVGMGNDPQGDFSAIEWGNGSHTLRIELNNSGEILESPILAVPHALWAEKAGGLAQGGAKFVGLFPLHGNGDGVTVISNGYWQQVTRTTYNSMEGFFSSVPISSGMTREYYLAIQSADNINSCSENSFWRFWFTWQNKPGHEYTQGRDWGGLNEGQMHYIQIPSVESQAEAIGFGENVYYRLEARIPDECPGSSMKVYSVHVIAIDRPEGNTPQISLNNSNDPGIASPVEIGPNGKVKFNESGSVTINGLLEAKHPIAIDLSNHSGQGGRNALYLYSSEDNDASVIISNKDKIALWSTSLNDRADLEVRNGMLSGTLETKQPITIDLSNHSGSGGRDALYLYSSEDNDASVIISNKDKIALWSTSLNDRADLEVRNAQVKILTILGGGDITEKVNSAEELQPGEVVVIDPSRPNHVLRSNQAYDRKVVGVVSGAGGIRSGLELQQDEVLEGDIPIAIAGRVKVIVTGKVEPGDLLTTSNVPGQAMKSKRFRKQNGAVIGKALSYPDKDGLVLMLVLPR